jgi:hypothetical protein
MLSMISSNRTTSGEVCFRNVRLAFRVHSGRLSGPGILPGTPDWVCLDLDFEDSRMNKFFQDMLCVAVCGAWVASRAQAEDTSSGGQFQSLMTSNGAPAVMSVVGTQGAMIVEASTNLTDWADVTMLFPNSGPGIFIDTEATNYSFRFYRVRTILSAANNHITVNSVGDLRMLSAVSGNADVTVRGYHAAGDGGGGQFYWDANSTDADDGGITIVPGGNPPNGRWKRIVQSEVNVKWFGAVADGATEDTLSIQAALDYVDRLGGGKVSVPKGVYFVSGGTTNGLRIGSNTLVEGAGASTVILSKAFVAISNKGWMWSWSDPSPGDNHITVQNLAIDCSNGGNNGVGFFGVTDSTIHNVRVINPKGYGIWLIRWGDVWGKEGKPPQRVTVSNCHLSGVVDVGIECSGAIGCNIVGNTVTGRNGIAGYLAWNGAKDCVFTGNIAEGEGTTNLFKGYEVQPSDSNNTNPVKTQTQRISFVGNVAKNVSVGFRIGGDPGNKPTDILVEGNSLVGFGQNSTGMLIHDVLRVSVLGNRISDFDNALMLNPANKGYVYNSAAYVTIDNNMIFGGRASMLYGNSSGSLTGNKFYGQEVQLYAWKNCTVNNNTSVNPGLLQETVAISVLGYDSVGSIGNSFNGNVCVDDRDTKIAIGTIAFSLGNHDRNFVTRNSAHAAKPGAHAFTNLGSGTGNIVAENIDAPLEMQ